MTISSINSTLNLSMQSDSLSSIDSQINQLLTEEQNIQKQLNEVKNDKTLKSDEKTKEIAELNQEIQQIQTKIDQLKSSKTKTPKTSQENKKLDISETKNDKENSVKNGIGVEIDKSV